MKKNSQPVFPRMLNLYGACQGEPVELFYDWDRQAEAAAKEVCAGCTVVDVCLGYAIEAREEGVWGGMTEEERDVVRTGRKLKRRRWLRKLRAQ